MKKMIYFSTFIGLTVITGAISGFSFKDASEKKVNIISGQQTFVSSDLEKSAQLFANKKEAKAWESFTIVPQEEGKIAIKASNNKFVTLDREGKLYAKALYPVDAEIFELVQTSDGRVAIKAFNGKFISIDVNKNYQLNANSTSISNNESFKLQELPE
ncbi:MAG TPA: hypothetical protein VHO72_10535 [Bacteroidales bacterium]|nr:hypothetical protein [Bacteroidales bacterium]